jgi:hypothetical protein
MKGKLELQPEMQLDGPRTTLFDELALAYLTERAARYIGLAVNVSAVCYTLTIDG